METPKYKYRNTSKILETKTLFQTTGQLWIKFEVRIKYGKKYYKEIIETHTFQRNINKKLKLAIIKCYQQLYVIIFNKYKKYPETITIKDYSIIYYKLTNKKYGQQIKYKTEKGYNKVYVKNKKTGKFKLYSKIPYKKKETINKKIIEVNNTF